MYVPILLPNTWSRTIVTYLFYLYLPLFIWQSIFNQAFVPFSYLPVCRECCAFTSHQSVCLSLFLSTRRSSFVFSVKSFAHTHTPSLYSTLSRWDNSENTNLRGSITVWLTSCLFCLESAVLLMLTVLLVLSNTNQSNWRSAVQWYFPLWWVFSG